MKEPSRTFVDLTFFTPGASTWLNFREVSNVELTLSYIPNICKGSSLPGKNDQLMTEREAERQRDTSRTSRQERMVIVVVPDQNREEWGTFSQFSPSVRQQHLSSDNMAGNRFPIMIVWGLDKNSPIILQDNHLDGQRVERK